MHKRLVFFTLLVPLSALASEPLAVDFRCLASSGPKPIRLEWRVFSDPATGWSGGYVKYRGAQQPIPIVPVKTETGERPEGRPGEDSTTWVEIVDGRIAGQYRVTTQGANILGFEYRNLRNGKQFAFSQDLAAGAGEKCVWK